MLPLKHEVNEHLVLTGNTKLSSMQCTLRGNLGRIICALGSVYNGWLCRGFDISSLFSWGPQPLGVLPGTSVA
jgi:hypothetical protein